MSLVIIFLCKRNQLCSCIKNVQLKLHGWRSGLICRLVDDTTLRVGGSNPTQNSYFYDRNWLHSVWELLCVN